MMPAESYQVEQRNPNGGRADYWGMVQERFKTRSEAAKWARGDCPAGWEWRVVRVSLTVVESGRKAVAA
jgi:hypothetical protein